MSTNDARPVPAGLKLGQLVHIRNHTTGTCAPALIFGLGEFAGDLVAFPGALVQRGVFFDPDPRPAHPSAINPSTGRRERMASWHVVCPEGR